MAFTWASVPDVTTGSAIPLSWGTTVKGMTDLAGPLRPRCHVNRTVGSGGVVGSTAGTITTTSVVNLDNVIHDNDSMYSANAVHIRTPGLWLVTLTAEWVDNGAAGLRSVAIWESTAVRWVASETKFGLTGVSTYHSLYAMERFDATHVLQPKVGQSSGSNAYFAANSYGLAISCMLMGN